MIDRVVKVILRGDIGDLVGKMAAAGRAVGVTADKMTAANKEADKFRRGLTGLGDSAGKIGLVAGAGLGVAVLAAANFDQAMSNVAAATHETTQNMELLRKAAIQAGQDTVFSASEAAGAIESLAKAGVSTQDILEGGLDGALNLAAAGGLAVADAADVAATALTQFKLAGEDVPHVADLLAAAAGKAQGDVTDMGFALKQSGLVASQMGLSIEETTGTLAAFASAGLLGSDAGTSFRTMLLRLANPSGEAAELMKKLGIAAYDAQGQFVGIRNLSDQLQRALGGQTQATRDAALATIFGSDAIRGANVLYEQGARGIQDWTNKVNDAGYAAETASTRLDNLKGDLEQLRGSLETALIGQGEGSQGPLRGLVQQVTDVVNAYNELPGAAKGAVNGVLAGTALLGGGLFIFSRLTRTIADTRRALDDLGPAGARAGRMLRTGLAVGATLEGIDLLSSAFDHLFDQSLENSNLGRSLTALSQGRVSGELRKYGEDLKGFSEDLHKVLDDDPLAGTARGLAKTPVVGDFLSGVPWQRSAQDAVANIKDLDEALAQLVESGQQAEAANIFQQLTDAAREGGFSASDLARAFEQYGLAVENTQPGAFAWLTTIKGTVDALTGAAPVTEQTSRAVQGLAQAQEDAAKKAEEAAEKLGQMRESARQTGREFFNLGERVNDNKVSLNQWVKDLENQAKALSDVTKNAGAAVKGGVNKDLVQELLDQGPAGALRLQELANASDDTVKRANEAWKRGRRGIKQFVDYYVQTFGELPPIKFDVETSAAERAIRRLKRELMSVPKEWRSTVYVNRLQGAALQAAGGRDGDPSTPYATGGWTGPGAKFQPKGVVHGNEYVFSSEATSTAGVGFLDGLHRTLRGYAAGGYVAQTSSPVAAMSWGIDYERLARAISAVRPVMGDMKVYPTNYNELLREMDAAQRRSAGDGIRR